jgi:hypothetical protein
MKSSRATLSIALRSRSERSSPQRLSSAIFACRSRRMSSPLLSGRLGGGMSHPLIAPRNRYAPADAPAARRDATARKGAPPGQRALSQPADVRARGLLARRQA